MVAKRHEGDSFLGGSYSTCIWVWLRVDCWAVPWCRAEVPCLPAPDTGVETASWLEQRSGLLASGGELHDLMSGDSSSPRNAKLCAGASNASVMKCVSRSKRAPRGTLTWARKGVIPGSN
eukprot:5586226-Amphidinium_carterae.2